MTTEYGYLGEVTLEEFGEIRKHFPEIVGIDTNGKEIVLGVPTSLSDSIIGLYQLIVAVWDDEEARSAAWEGIM